MNDKEDLSHLTVENSVMTRAALELGGVEILITENHPIIIRPFDEADADPVNPLKDKPPVQ